MFEQLGLNAQPSNLDNPHTKLPPASRLPLHVRLYACTTHPPLSRAHLSPDRPVALRAILYFFGLLWSFLGVGIISDIFMLAIEVR